MKGLVCNKRSKQKVFSSHAERYEADVPDTLDLAECGALAINCLTGCLDPPAFRVEFSGPYVYLRIIDGKLAAKQGKVKSIKLNYHLLTGGCGEPSRALIPA